MNAAARRVATAEDTEPVPTMWLEWFASGFGVAACHTKPYQIEQNPQISHFTIRQAEPVQVMIGKVVKRRWNATTQIVSNEVELVEIHKVCQRRRDRARQFIVM